MVFLSGLQTLCQEIINSCHNDSTRPYGIIFACDQEKYSSAICPGLGHEGFERRRVSFPSVIQYERIEKLAENRPIVQTMNSLDEASWVANGTIQGTGSH